ncbi:hypothetical protein LTR67_008362 [Exophiala xenobiotica]
MDPQISPPRTIAPSLHAQQLTPTSKKRNYEGQLVNHPSSITPPLDLRSTPLTGTRSRSVSPALSAASTSLTELGSTPALSPSKSDMASSDSKKRKLTFAEREVEKALKKQEKEEKDRQKAEAKAKKEEEKHRKEVEKAKKEEERRAKDAAKEEKQRQKDAVKAEKDAEKERRAAEKLKKERAQMRIGAFFARPGPTSTPPASPDDVSLGTPSRRSSTASIDMEPPLLETKAQGPANPEYTKWILPFFINEHMELAPFNRFHSKSTIGDTLPLKQDAKPEKLDRRFHKRRRRTEFKPAKVILEGVSNSSNPPNDQTETGDALASLPYKYLFFVQDIRPPYQGTYTRAVSPRSARKIAVNPSHRGLPDTNYDYDSEAEWQEPEEGDDDLMDEDEKSEDEDGDEDMDDFLDDEGDSLKRQAVSEMEPKSSGLCWEGAASHQGVDLSVYRIDVLHDSTTFPIDPFSTKHWSDTGKTSPAKREKANATVTQAPMQPPRLPLTAVDPNGGNLTPPSAQSTSLSAGLKTENKSTQSKANKSAKPLKLIDVSLLPAFKQAVSGSTSTKLGLVEILKQQFPKCPKDAIKNTLEAIAARQGTKEAEKKWVLIE